MILYTKFPRVHSIQRNIEISSSAQWIVSDLVIQGSPVLVCGVMGMNATSRRLDKSALKVMQRIAFITNEAIVIGELNLNTTTSSSTGLGI